MQSVLHVTEFVLERLPFVFGDDREVLLLEKLLQLLLCMADRHRCACGPDLWSKGGCQPLPQSQALLH